MAILYHGLMIEDVERRHQYCPTESWCAYKRGAPVPTKIRHLHECFEELLLSVYIRYTQRSMLNRLLAGFTTNDLECFNSKLLTKEPKHKFHGLKHMESAVVMQSP